jgi:hypothetical protein
MIEALLHGKLSRQQENMEDILTSCVFGVFQYAPPALGLLPFLAQAVPPFGRNNPASLDCADDILSDEIEYEFWPTWHEQNDRFQCEPDVSLLIPCRQRPPFLVGIEAKLQSGKSSSTDERADIPTDQLAREWQCLLQQAARRSARPVLIYVTADVICPNEQLDASLADCRRCAPDAPVPDIRWLTWRHLPELTRNTLPPQLQDLGRLAENMNLVFYSGISLLAATHIDWSFDGSLSEWSFAVDSLSCNWRFVR